MIDPVILATHDWTCATPEVWQLRRRAGCWAFWEVVDGRVRWRRGDGSVQYLSPGSVLWRWRGVSGALDLPKGCRLRGVEFDVRDRPRQPHARYGLEPTPGGARQPTPMAILDVAVEPILDPVAAEIVRRLLDRITSRWWRGEQDRLVCSLQVGGACADLIDHFAQTGDTWIEQAESHARRLLRRGVTVADMARSVGMPLSSFSERYRAERGEAPSAFLRRLRFEQAAQELETSAQSVADIAHHCGYRNARSFGRAFRAAMGMSPRMWRERRRSAGC